MQQYVYLQYKTNIDIKYVSIYSFSRARKLLFTRNIIERTQI